MKILLLGKNGQLGWELQRSLAPLGDVIAIDREQGGDLAHTEALVTLAQRIAPQVIVNAAAYTAVDKAESEPDRVMQINAAAPTALASVAKDMGALLVHYSSDYVFDGSGAHSREEGAPRSALSVYGHSKVAAEVGIESVGCHHLILRTSWVYGARGGNFAKTMLRLASQREQLQVIDDQMGAPTGADLLADLSAHMIRATVQRPELGGLYHAVASGHTSWHGYACHVIDFARSHGLALKVSKDQVQAIPTAQYPTPAKRPLNSRLSTTKLQQTFGLTLPPWQQGVERMLLEILPTLTSP